jgi:biopolymer transport protein TolQ
MQSSTVATQVVSMDFGNLILSAGPVGKFVLLVLLAQSLFSWTIIFAKWRTFKVVLQENARFLNDFWNAASIEDIFVKSDQYQESTVATTFKSGVKELKKIMAQPEIEADQNDSHLALDNVSRSLARTSTAEIATLEKNIGWLATTASAAPFIGLFGTVWGIMDAFQKIGASGSANLAVVAPGISEALIATAFGIGAAIPAVIAYNHFSTQIRRIAIDMDGFSQDFLNIVQRSNLHRPTSKKA